MHRRRGPLPGLVWEPGSAKIGDFVYFGRGFTVVAHTNSTGGLKHQMRFHPYGKWTAYENHVGLVSPHTPTSGRAHTSFGPWGLALSTFA